MEHRGELERAIADLEQIKDAIGKSSGIMRFVDAGRAFEGVLLALGLLIIAFSTIHWLLASHYGSFAAAPGPFRAGYFVLIALSVLAIARAKTNSIIRSGRRHSHDLGLWRLFREVYSPRMLSVLVPFYLAAILIVTFLSGQGAGVYIIPALAVLFGLLSIAVLNILYMSQLFLFGWWLVATGLCSLFYAEQASPYLLLLLTFSAGCLVMSIVSRFTSSDRGRSR